MTPKKSLAELEEREYQEAELSVKKQLILKKELEARGASLSVFREPNGKVIWSRVINWLKTH